jgi:hypothetical protein
VRALVALLGVAIAAAAQTKSDPCSLVTRAEVQEAVGRAVADGKRNAINPAICDFATGNMSASVSIMLVDKAPGDSAEKVVAEMKKRKVATEIIPGLGDGAYTTDAGYGMRLLGVYKGSKHAVVTVMLPDAPGAKAKAIAEQVMRKALARLP